MLHCNQSKANMLQKHKGRNSELDNNTLLAVLSMLHGMAKFTKIEARDMKFVVSIQPMGGGTPLKRQ